MRILQAAALSALAIAFSGTAKEADASPAGAFKNLCNEQSMKSICRPVIWLDRARLCSQPFQMSALFTAVCRNGRPSYDVWNASRRPVNISEPAAPSAP